MIPSTSLQLPQCRLHKPSGRAVVTINYKDHYLGARGTPEGRSEYNRLIGEWLAGNYRREGLDL